MFIRVFCALLLSAAPVHANRLAGNIGRPVSLKPVLAVPALTAPLAGTLNSGPGAISLTDLNSFGVLPLPTDLPTLWPTANIQALKVQAVPAAVLPAAPAASILRIGQPPGNDAAARVGNTRISAPVKQAVRAAEKAFPLTPGQVDKSAALGNLFDASLELPDGAFGVPVDASVAINSEEELSFAAKASWNLGRMADDIAAEKGQTSSQMSTHDFVELMREAKDQFILTHKSLAPTPGAFKASVSVIDSIIHIVATLGAVEEPLHNKVRRILSVWNIFNQAMVEASEMGSLGDIIGEAKLFAHQVEQSVETAVPLKTTETGIIETDDVETGLQALREASHPLDAAGLDLLAKIKEHHPELPLDADRIFLIKDQAMLDTLNLPADAAGAARVLSDGKRQENIILLVAPKGIAADNFVEFVIHEAVHLADGGILHVENARAIEHWLAEGYTQLRAHEMANESLALMGRPTPENPAYDQEVKLVEKFISKYGDEAMKDLVRNGSNKGLQTALGERWKYVKRLMEFDNRSTHKRTNLLNALYGVLLSPEFGEAQFTYLVNRFSLQNRPLN